jgi:cytochrome c551/c552
MTQNKPKANRLPIYITAVLIVVILVAFGVVLATNLSSANSSTGEPISANSYRERVDALLAIGQPENAEAALVKYTCSACHRGENSIGPLFVGVAERAATRRPPMPADAYIYESIIHPGAYVVEGYQNVMLPDIGDRISDQELADVLTYLLTPDAH